MAKAVDYTNVRFGRLVVTGEVMPRKAHRRMYVTCDCGTSKEVFLTSLKTDTQSCGCLARELATTHGNSEAGNKLYRAWVNMRQRCENPNHQFYGDYGGRGVSVCPEWQDFGVFRTWAMGNGYTDGLTLDREGNGLLYSPEFCRWTNRTAQQRNRRAQRGSTSKYVGVSFNVRGNKWQAGIKIAGKSINLGWFDQEEDAARARDAYVTRNQLEDFTLNFE